MGKSFACIAVVLALNLLCSIVSSTHVACPPPPTPPCPPPPTPPCPPSPPTPKSCPRDTLKLGICSNALNLLRLKLGKPPKKPCCSLLKGLVDIEAAVCLCTAIKANILGISLNVPIDLSLLLNFCGKKVPSGFKCA